MQTKFQPSPSLHRMVHCGIQLHNGKISKIHGTEIVSLSTIIVCFHTMYFHRLQNNFNTLDFQNVFKASFMNVQRFIECHHQKENFFDGNWKFEV